MVAVGPGTIPSVVRSVASVRSVAEVRVRVLLLTAQNYITSQLKAMSATLRIMVTVFAFAACSPDFAHIEGSHLVYEHNASLKPCAGTAPYMDRVVPFLATQFSTRAPDHVRFTWIEPGDQGALFDELDRTVGQHA